MLETTCRFGSDIIANSTDDVSDTDISKTKH